MDFLKKKKSCSFHLSGRGAVAGKKMERKNLQRCLTPLFIWQNYWQKAEKRRETLYAGMLSLYCLYAYIMIRLLLSLHSKDAVIAVWQSDNCLESVEICFSLKARGTLSGMGSQ